MDGMAPHERDRTAMAATGDTISSAVITRPTTSALTLDDDGRRFVLARRS
jgi:hypothetical protein